MRELLAHPLSPLRIAILLFLFSGVVVSATSLPLPIGRLSDYGNVLDRHGREQISSLIDEAQARFGIEVTIHATWENPYEDLNRYTYALLDAWNLARGKTLLVVFLKEGRNWQVKVLAGDQTASVYPGLARAIETGITDLVDHRRIEEAMVKLFDLLARYIAPQSGSPSSVRETHGSRALAILFFIASLVLTSLFIHRRICPRCGRILRVRESRAFGPYGERDVVYYCRRCGYSRTKNRRGPGGRGG